MKEKAGSNTQNAKNSVLQQTRLQTMARNRQFCSAYVEQRCTCKLIRNLVNPRKPTDKRVAKLVHERTHRVFHVSSLNKVLENFSRILYIPFLIRSGLPHIRSPLHVITYFRFHTKVILLKRNHERQIYT